MRLQLARSGEGNLNWTESCCDFTMVYKYVFIYGYTFFILQDEENGNKGGML